jgi:hypothetical protein
MTLDDLGSSAFSSHGVVVAVIIYKRLHINFGFDKIMQMAADRFALCGAQNLVIADQNKLKKKRMVTGWYSSDLMFKKIYKMELRSGYYQMKGLSNNLLT